MLDILLVTFFKYLDKMQPMSDVNKLINKFFKIIYFVRF